MCPTPPRLNDCPPLPYTQKNTKQITRKQHFKSSRKEREVTISDKFWTTESERTALKLSWRKSQDESECWWAGFSLSSSRLGWTTISGLRRGCRHSQPGGRVASHSFAAIAERWDRNRAVSKPLPDWSLLIVVLTLIIAAQCELSVDPCPRSPG